MFEALFGLFRKRGKRRQDDSLSPDSSQRSTSISDWSSTRAPPSRFDLQLLPLTEEWLQSLPPQVRPVQLATRHPRLANRLALCWKDLALAQRLLDQLLMGDERRERKGFPANLAAELLVLREHVERLQRRQSS